MGEVLKYMLLGLLQGATEFLPVSSSGHLFFLKNLLGVKSEEGLLMEVCLHLGTLVAVLLVLRRDLWKLAVDGVKGAGLLIRGRRGELAEAAPEFSTALAVVAGSVPAAAVGLLIHRRGIEESLANPRLVGAMLVITGLVLAASRLAPRGLREGPGAARGFLIGIAQAVAILPGLSRSGSTIVTGCFLGLKRDAAVRFSFVLAVPVMVGAGVFKIAMSLGSGGEAWVPSGGGPSLAIACGTVVAALSGWACLRLLLRIIRRGQLHWFAAYCLPAGLALFILSFIS